jgi:hypothetical protein
MNFKPSKIIIHCSDSTWGSASEIDKWHKERGWDGIGYHKVILNSYKKGSGKDDWDLANDGVIEEGRPLTKQGAHCRGHNSTSISICLIGKDEFTPKQCESLAELCHSLMEEYGISSDDIYGHNEFSIKTCPNFSVDDFVEDCINLPEAPDIIEGAKDSLKAIRDMSNDIVTDEEMLDCMQTLRRYFKQ